MAAKPVKPRASGRVSVDGEDFDWSVSREPQYSSVDGWLGLTLSIRAVEGDRELLLQYPNAGGAPGNVPASLRPRISPLDVERGIRDAMEAGWNPASRGKSYRYEWAG